MPAPEVDYVDSRGRGIWAIEFKSGRSGKAADLPCFRNRYLKTKALRVGI